MEVTDVRVEYLDGDVLKAFVTITFNDVFIVRGLKVIRGQDRLFVSMPARRKSDGAFQDIAHPIDRHTRDHIEQTVLDAYENGGGPDGAGARMPLRPRPPSRVGTAARVVQGERPVIHVTDARSAAG